MKRTTKSKQAKVPATRRTETVAGRPSDYLMVRCDTDQKEVWRTAMQRYGYRQLSPWVRSILDGIANGSIKIAA